MAFQVSADNITQGTDGLYAVCFRNYHGKSKEEITEVFGKYGNVQSIRFAGADNTGMTFVRYKEYEETKRCLEELGKTKEFNVRMAHSSIKPKDDNGNKFKPQNDHRNFQKNSDENNSARFNDNSNYKRNFHDQKGKLNFPRKSMHHGDNENLDLNNRSKKNHKDSDTRSQKSNSSSKHNDSVSDCPPPLVYANDIPPLLDTSDIPALIDKQMKIKAVDVILANFPIKICDSEIHTLMRDCGIKVVAMSRIEVTGIQFNIPYCHLWLDSLYEADVAESKLNGLTSWGRKLVAVKTHSLLNDR